MENISTTENQSVRPVHILNVPNPFLQVQSLVLPSFQIPEDVQETAMTENNLEEDDDIATPEELFARFTGIGLHPSDKRYLKNLISR